MTTPQDWEQRILAGIDETSHELLDLAGLLIRTPSENPDGDCTDVAAVIAGHLADAGLSNESHDAGDGRVSVVAHSGTVGEGERHLVLAGHHDVVPVGDVTRWSFPPFAGDVVDGWLRGRGASDMKAGLAGLIHVYVLLHRLGVPLRGRLSLTAVPDEETGGDRGADWLLARGVVDGATGAIIAEPSERAHPTIGQKGSSWFRLTIHGRPGHGSLQPLHGTSANLLAARAIVALQRLWELTPNAPEDVRPLIESSKRYAEEREGFGAGVGEIFERVSLNIGTVRGGTSTNVVADTCVVDCDSRVPIGLTREQVFDKVRAILAEEGIEADVEPLGFASEANWTGTDDPIVATLVGVLRELHDPEAEGVLQWASSDARTFRAHHIPVLQYGPADPHTIHGFDERAHVDDIVLAAKVYALTVVRYLGLTD
ncbi:succinyl-diaminopimelate desuccinylase [Tessaracoccus aquimaris]|uniref:Probable succinyl-diaminopimelate desuccinylase n=1 Tax=Tessaracoccus aquimaris TaxID=1332264 RepID=A0A1Q2CL39_9ACTN|nr:M20 family metallopeptidase [Tessaracoccus aquimaris]AQP46822.1 succinyl-diaminopimelate desuccinylase [Tessaracoccus aquimaris]